MIPDAILVIVVTSAALALCGAIAWIGERAEKQFKTWRARRTEKRIRDGLPVGFRNGGFRDGAIL